MSKAVVGYEYAGLSLNKVAYNVLAIGAPEQVPDRRSDNLIIPHKTGRMWVPKYFDQRVLPLSMFVQARPTDGGVRSAATLWANLDTLKALFAKPGRHTLKYTGANNEVRQAEAEVIRSVPFQAGGPWHYRFLVEFTFPDVWWGAASAVIAGPTTITSTSQVVTVTNAGTYQNEKAVINLTGGITNPKFSLTVDGVAMWLKYTGEIPVGSALNIDCSAYEALLYSSGGAVHVDVTDHLTYANTIPWLPLAVGANAITVTSDAISGSPLLRVTFTPVFV